MDIFGQGQSRKAALRVNLYLKIFNPHNAFDRAQRKSSQRYQYGWQFAKRIDQCDLQARMQPDELWP
jgi:hypothetical protein